MEILFIYLIIINVAGFSIMYIDKKKAIKKKYRISEKTLFLVCIIGGSLGLLIGMYTFRHKTKHKKFVIGVPVFLILNLFMSIFITNHI